MRRIVLLVIAGMGLFTGRLACVHGQAAPDSLMIRRFEILKSTNIGGELIPHSVIREVYVFPRKEFRNSRQRRIYNRLVLNIKKVYPYAQHARLTIEEMEAHLATLSGEKERNAYIDEMEKQLFSEFEDDIRHMTLTQGKILVKLIDRETGDTSYELLKEFKGSLTAFFWQSIARIFGSNLKLEYDPYGEDREIEEIVQMIEMGFI